MQTLLQEYITKPVGPDDHAPLLCHCGRASQPCTQHVRQVHDFWHSVHSQLLKVTNKLGWHTGHRHTCAGTGSTTHCAVLHTCATCSPLQVACSPPAPASWWCAHHKQTTRENAPCAAAKPLRQQDPSSQLAGGSPTASTTAGNWTHTSSRHPTAACPHAVVRQPQAAQAVAVHCSVACGKLLRIRQRGQPTTAPGHMHTSAPAAVFRNPLARTTANFQSRLWLPQ
jgi:hypothetical protein